MKSILSLDSVTKKYPRNKLVAVDGLSLNLPAQGVVGLLGANGAGKTTTIKMICGLVTPTSGIIQIGGHDLQKARGAALQHIGAVLEGARNIYWRLTAWQNLLYFGRLKGMRGSVLTERAETLLRLMNLWERRGDDVGLFSRGMQQKIAIAAALMPDPPILLLDEPTLGLDVEAAQGVKTLLSQLAADKLIVLTTHQLDLAQAVCERIVIIRRGRVIADQATQTLLARFQGDFYAITWRGGGDVAWSGFRIEQADDHTTAIGPIADSATLYARLDDLRTHGAALVSVQPVAPDLETIFLELHKAQDA